MADYVTFRRSVSDLSWMRGWAPSSSVYFQLLEISKHQLLPAIEGRILRASDLRGLGAVRSGRAGPKWQSALKTWLLAAEPLQSRPELAGTSGHTHSGEPRYRPGFQRRSEERRQERK